MSVWFDLNPTDEMIRAAQCPATVDIKGTTVLCGKKPDGHDTHLGRHCGWDVVW